VTPIDAVLDYLRGVARLRGDRPGFTFGSVEAYLLAHGRAWAPGPVTAHTASMTPCQCYDNAFKLARRARLGLRYVEGVALPLKLCPLDHAWCVDAADRVVDPTWDHGVAYFGVVFAVDEVRTLRRESRQFSMLWDHPRDFPLLRAPGTPPRHPLRRR
jgi:hypothetical protein